jgi:hypothetical protein
MIHPLLNKAILRRNTDTKVKEMKKLHIMREEDQEVEVALKESLRRKVMVMEIGVINQLTKREVMMKKLKKRLLKSQRKKLLLKLNKNLNQFQRKMTKK